MYSGTSVKTVPQAMERIQPHEIDRDQIAEIESHAR
jgi:hypothetical protein